MNWIRGLAQGKKKDPVAHMNRIQMNPDEKQTEPKGATTMFACHPGIGKNFRAGEVKKCRCLGCSLMDHCNQSHRTICCGEESSSRENDVPAASQGSHQITEVTGSGGGVREEVGQDMPAGV